MCVIFAQSELFLEKLMIDRCEITQLQLWINELREYSQTRFRQQTAVLTQGVSG